MEPKSNEHLEQELEQQLQNQLKQHVGDIIKKNYQISQDRFMLLVYDMNCLLARMLKEAYSSTIVEYRHEMIDFNTVVEEDFLKRLEELPSHSLVILVQSGSFRTTKHHLRRDLVGFGHDVIEHARLGHNTVVEIKNYIASLVYDMPYYVKICDNINQLLCGGRREILIESLGGLRLIIDSEYEKPILNTGDFSNIVVKSGGFPIGEIFTEARDLDAMSGELLVFGFPGLDHLTHFVDVPFVVRIEGGRLVKHNGPVAFEEMLGMIRSEEEGEVWVREIGFGLNRGLGFEKRITEPTAFERFAGMHFSLGKKHDMYRKKISKNVLQKYHVDIFCLVERMSIGGVVVFENGRYV